MSKATTIDQLKKLATRTGLEVKEIRKKGGGHQGAHRCV